MSQQIEWRAASGYGVVETYTIVRRAVSKAYEPDVPYVIALINLAEGPRMMSNIIGCDVDSVECGMAVEVVFEAWSADITIPKFRPVMGQPTSKARFDPPCRLDRTARPILLRSANSSGLSISSIGILPR
jgi:hypothetical protein